MKQLLLSFLKTFIPFAVILYLLHLAVEAYVIPETQTYYAPLAIHGFLVVATFLIYLFLVFVHQNFKEKTGFAFMAASLLKMLAAVIFLLPMLTSNVGQAFQNLMLFFVPYFLFLIFETIYAVKLLNLK